MSIPTVSIIIPVFNAAATLQRCIDSIIAQTIKDFQLILVDDGSTDMSGVICDKNACADERVMAIHKKNGGVSSARNEGLNAATGKYICFADADDYVENRWIESLISSVSRGSNYLPVCQVIQHKNSRCTAMYNFKSGCHLLKDLYHLEGWGYVWNKMFLADRIEQYGIRFNESLKVYEDELFVATYTASGFCGFAFSDIPSYNYINPDYFSAKYPDADTVDKLIYQYVEMKEVNQEAANYVVDRLVMVALSSYRHNQDESIIFNLCDVVGKSIRYVYGTKKKLLRALSLFTNHRIWLFAFKLYSKLKL